MEQNNSFVIGWREWVSLPDLGIPAIKAKVDTGAKTSALHAFRIEEINKDGNPYVKFWLHPLRKNKDIELACEAPLKEKRIVKDSGGHEEERHVIESLLRVGDHNIIIELTLTSRDNMIFRMLLGRTAIINGKLTVNPSESYVTGQGLGEIYKSNIQ